jgi:hypothetical protein
MIESTTDGHFASAKERGKSAQGIENSDVGLEWRPKEVAKIRRAIRGWVFGVAAPAKESGW